MAQTQKAVAPSTADFSSSDRFYSPLVKNIAKEEGVSMEELEAIIGTGSEGRVTKNDIFHKNALQKGFFFWRISLASLKG